MGIQMRKCLHHSARVGAWILPLNTHRSFTSIKPMYMPWLYFKQMKPIATQVNVCNTFRDDTCLSMLNQTLGNQFSLHLPDLCHVQDSVSDVKQLPLSTNHLQ